MTTSIIFQGALYLAVLGLLAWPLGCYISWVFQRCDPNARLGSFEASLLKLCGVQSAEEMRWREYATCAIGFSVCGVVALFAMQRLQGMLPLNPQAIAGVPADLAFNTAVSFATNTNWQAYSGESTLSYCTQMIESAADHARVSRGASQSKSACEHRRVDRKNPRF